MVPLLADVGDGDGEDAGQTEPLQESPKDKGPQSGRSGGEKGRHRQSDGGGEDDTLAIEALGEGSHDGRRKSDPEGGGADGESHDGLRLVEDAGEERQQRLRDVKIEEGEDSASGIRRQRSKAARGRPGRRWQLLFDYFDRRVRGGKRVEVRFWTCGIHVPDYGHLLNRKKSVRT